MPVVPIDLAATPVTGSGSLLSTAQGLIIVIALIVAPIVVVIVLRMDRRRSLIRPPAFNERSATSSAIGQQERHGAPGWYDQRGAQVSPGPGSRQVAAEVDEAGAASPPAPTAPVTRRSLDELLEGWAALLAVAPKPSRAEPKKHVRFLAQKARLPEEVVDHVRKVRNRCAHPDRDGWPSPGDMDTALTTLAELRRRIPR